MAAPRLTPARLCAASARCSPLARDSLHACRYYHGMDWRVCVETARWVVSTPDGDRELCTPHAARTVRQLDGGVQ